MREIQVASSQDIVKSLTTLDKIPEDVQVAIIKVIQSWKRSEGTEDEREKGKRARDSALRSVALSCRTLLSIYQRELLSDVTLNFRSVVRFYLLLVRNRDTRKFVRSITFTQGDDYLTQEESDAAEKDLKGDSNEVFEALTAQEIRIDQGKITVEKVVEGVYQFLNNIQTLVIRKPQFIMPLQFKLAIAKPAPLPFLTRSLKKLFIEMWENVEDNLKARNVVWILVFCTGLRSACLGCTFDENDFKYLVEFSDTFPGLSRVQKLALGVDFAEEESTRRYWDKGAGKRWIGGNRKTEAIFYLLKVTQNLQCLEINSLPTDSEEISHIRSSCLRALRTSYLSLESLRLFDLEINLADLEESRANSNFSPFQNLKVISLDASLLVLLARITEIKLPPALEVLRFPYYSSQTFQEDMELVRILKSRSFPNLVAVILPSTPIIKNGIQADSEDFKRRWLEGRRELEKAEIFQSGKVKLRLVDPGEFIGEPSEIDFMSHLTWLSPL